MENNNNNEYPRLVSWSYSPALPYLKGDKERLTEVYLTSPAGESVLKAGLLPQLGFMMHKDPYFKVKYTEGRTKNARSHGDIVRKFKKNYPKLQDKLKSTAPTTKLLNFGDYIFINLLFINNYVNPIVNKENWYNEQYIKKEFFNEEFIRELIDYRPLDLFNHREITNYQKEELPEFLRALSLFDNELYNKSTKGTAFEDKPISYIGLKARLNTLKPGKVLYKYNFTKDEFSWDGELLSRTKKLDDGSTLLVKPSSEATVEIVDNKTVSSGTVFI